MMRKIRNKMAKDEPLLQQVSQIYSKDIYAESASNPTSKFESQINKFLDSVVEEGSGKNSDKQTKDKEEELTAFKPWDNQMMWNYFLIRDFYGSIKRKKWCMPVIHGYIDQKNFQDGGNRFSFMVIARRSRHYAGTRYLRRGINHEGYIANWVEIEQIVDRHSNALHGSQPMLSSFVQVRGSIPFFWT